MTQADQDHRLLGKTLSGRYLLEELLGQGGFAVVFRARDQVLDQDVALKLMSPHLLDSKARDAFLIRFEREAKLVASFQHSNIARVFDTGAVEEEGYLRPYLVMELLRGKDLDDILRDERWLAPERAIELILQALDALAYVHQRGVIHRDLKPANLFVTPSTGLRGREHLHVMDFGIALHDQFANDRLTGSMGTIGTMHYLPPEYLERGEISPAMDTYQMGLILCELMTGQPMVEGSGLQAAFKIQKRGVELPEVFHGHACESFLLKSIDPNPKLRFQNAAEMFTALEKLTTDDFPQKAHAHIVTPSGQSFYLDDTIESSQEAQATFVDSPPTFLDAPPINANLPSHAAAAPALKEKATIATPPQVAFVTQQGARGRARTFALAAIALLALGGIGAAALMDRPSEPAVSKDRTVQAVQPPPIAAIDTTSQPSTTTPSSPPAALVDWTWEINSTPEGAEVWLDDAQVGVTPMTLTFARDQIKKVEIELRAKNHKRESFKSLTNADRTIDIELEPLGRRKPRDRAPRRNRTRRSPREAAKRRPRRACSKPRPKRRSP